MSEDIKESKAAEEKYRLLFEQNPDAILLIDENGKIVMANDAFCMLVEDKKVEGKFFFDYIAKEDKKHFLFYYKRRKKITLPSRYSFTLITHKGQRREVDGTIILLPDKKTSLTVLRDITPLIEAEARFQALSEETPVGVFFIEEGKFTYVNPKIAKIFETTPKEMIGKNLLEFVAPTSRKIVEKAIKNKLSERKKADQYEFQGLTAKGRIITCEVRSQSITYRGKPAIVGSLIDITERKKQEMELIRAKEEALSANRAKTAFLANMSHEMRTPLNAILGFTELLFETNLTPQQKEYVKTIFNSAKHLNDLISQVLDISQIEAGIFKIEKKPTSLKKLIEEVASIIKQRALIKGLKFKLSLSKKLPERILTDPLRLRQALLNLLHNALKYTEYGYISLSVKHKNKKLIFTIKDTGCGIPKEKLPHIFERFLPFERKEGGLGLGLAITKEVIEKLGGAIKVKSQIQRGTIFEVNLPIEEAKKEEILPKADVLLIEGDELTAKLILSYLQTRGLSTYTLKEGNQAIKMAMKLHPSFIMLNLLLPDIFGFEILRELKQNEKTKRIPVIIYSTFNEKLFTFGIADYLKKPITKKEILRVVLPYLHRKGDIFIIDNDETTVEFIAKIIKKLGYKAETFLSAKDAIEALNQKIPFLLIINPFLPKIDIFKLFSNLKFNKIKDVPIVVFISKKLSKRKIYELKEKTIALVEKEGENKEKVIGLLKKFLEIPQGLVLLAEDDPASQRLIKNILEKEGISVDVVEDGESAINAAHKKAYDLIIMDMRMPKLDGYEATRHLKSDPETRNIPIIALTAYALKEDKKRCLEAGADDYLAKPVSKREILCILKKYIEASRKVEEEEDRKYYINYLKETIQKMESAFKTGDIDTFLRLAHNLKGSGQAYGFTEISLLGKMLEEEIKKGEKEIVNLLFTQLCQKVKEYGTN